MNARQFFRSCVVGVLATAAAVASAGLPGPDHLIYGLPLDGETPVTTGSVGLVLDGETDSIAAYRLGSDPTLGPQFLLRVPMDHPGTRVPGRAQEGDVAQLLLNGQPAGEIVIGRVGSVQRHDADLQSTRAMPSMSIDDAVVGEADAGVLTAHLTISLSKATTSKVTVDWVTADGSAVGASSCGSGVDYLRASGVATINPGDVEATIDVAICDDDDAEGDEIFFVNLSSPVEAVLLDPQGQATILDDDTPPAVSIDDPSVVQPETGTTTVVFTLVLDHVWDMPVAVDYRTSDGTAQAGTDYLATAGTAIIVAGDLQTTVVVEVLSDAPFQGEKNFYLDLFDPDQCTIADDRGEAVIVGSRQVLRWAQAARDPGGATDGAFAVAVSPDSAHVYVAGRSRDALLVFDRDPADGTLSLLRAYTASDFDGDQPFVGLEGPEDLLVSPDGATLWVAAADAGAVTAFARNGDAGDPDFGLLTLIEVERDGVDDPDDDGPKVDGLGGATALAVSPNGDSLYVAGFLDNALTVFRVDAATGALSFEEVEIDGVEDAGDFGGVVDGLSGVSDVVVAPDGLTVYATGSAENAVAVFERQNTDATGTLGRLSFLESKRQGVDGVTALEGAIALTPSPDGAHLYVCGFFSGGVQVFDRATDGSLTAQSALIRPEVAGAVALVSSGDGRYLYLSSWEGDALVVLRRDEETISPDWGDLRYIESHRDGIGGVDGTWGPLGLGVSADDDTVYVAGYLDNAVGVFSRDLAAPTGLIVESTSHTENVPSNDPILVMQWYGASDGPLGSGVAGYSFLFDQTPDTVPDEIVDMAHEQDPHTVSSDPLADGLWYFHIRACDAAGNCGPAVHSGPFFIDTTLPAGPADLHSTSHTVGVPNDANVIVMAWTGATDDGSGLAGYATAFDQNPAAGCPGAITLPAGVEGASSAPLADGVWYFHICAVDAAGNAGAPGVGGPYVIGNDLTAPRVDIVRSITPADGGPIADGDVNASMITQVLLTFSEPMDETGGVLGSTVAYRVISAGPNGVIDSTSCSGIGGDDVNLPLADAQWDAPSTTVAVRVSSSLDQGRYALMACADAGLQDLAGNALDGNGDGTGGDDFIRVFDQSRSGMLANPNFDRNLVGWSLSDQAAISFGAADGDGFDRFSGSALMSRPPAGERSFAIAQCLDVTTARGWEWAQAGLVTLSESTPPEAPPSRAWGTTLFYPAGGCAGAALADEISTSLVEDDTGGTWNAFGVEGLRVPVDAVSVLVSFRFETPEGWDEPADASFDDLVFAVRDPGPVLVSIGDVAVDEGDVGLTPMAFGLSLSHPSPDPISVDAATVAGGTATAGVDFQLAAGTVLFAPGTLDQTFVVDVVGDLIDEPDETVRVDLSSPLGAVLGDAQATGTIVDDDPMPLLDGVDAEVCESEPSVTATFTLDLVSAFDVAFTWTTVDRTAVAGEDYVAASGAGFIPAGSLTAEVSVDLLGDDVQEGDEFFEIAVTGASAAVAGFPARVTIMDNDPSSLPGDAWPDCVFDSKDIEQIMRAIADAGYDPPGNADCDSSGGAIDDADLRCVIEAIFSGN